MLANGRWDLIRCLKVLKNMQFYVMVYVRTVLCVEQIQHIAIQVNCNTAASARTHRPVV